MLIIYLFFKELPEKKADPWDNLFSKALAVGVGLGAVALLMLLLFLAICILTIALRKKNKRSALLSSRLV